MKALETIAKAELGNVPVGAMFVGALGITASTLLAGFFSAKLSEYSTKWAGMNLDRREDVMRSLVGGGLGVGVPQLKGLLGEAFTKSFAIGSGGFAGAHWLNRLIQWGMTKAAATPVAGGAPKTTQPAPGVEAEERGSAEAAARLLGML